MRRLSILIAALAATASAASAQRLENRTAVFSALDKVTARISVLEVELDKTVRFGSLKVTPRACYSRPATELPKTSTFVEVEEVQLDGTEKRIFAGWMFAESPGLNAVEHPVFDVWLTGCAGAQTVAQRGQSRPTTPDASAQQTPADPIERRRVRR